MVKEMKNIQALLFDMDGVILDSMPWHVLAWKKALEEAGCQVKDELIYMHEGAIEPATAAKIFHSNGCCMDEELFGRVLKRQIEIFNRDYRKKVQIYEGVPDLLADLKREGRSLALVTSSHSHITREVLPSSVRSLFSAVVTGDAVTRRKPWPDPYLAAMKAMGLFPESCCVIENAPAGIEAALAAEMTCIAIKTTLDARHLARADHIVENHQELKALLTENRDSLEASLSEQGKTSVLDQRCKV